MARTRMAAPAVALLTLALGLVGCTNQPAPRPIAPPKAPSEEPAVYHPDGSADDNLPYFTDTLQALSASEAAIEGAPIVDALASAGFDKTAMQVSFDQSKTGERADSIYVSVRFDTRCVIGQIVTADRSVTTVAEGAVGPNEDLCLIGNTRPIDW